MFSSGASHPLWLIITIVVPVYWTYLYVQPSAEKMGPRPPTVHNSGGYGSSRSPVSRTSRGGVPEEKPDSDLLVRVKYNNALPDIPFDPKFLIYPFEPTRFVQYKPTSLEKNYKFELLAEPDLGVHIDLINPETYDINEFNPPQLHPDDEKLLEDEPLGGSSTPGTDSKTKLGRHARIVPWLRKTEYISSEFNRYGVSTERNETQVGYNVKKKIAHELVYKDRDSQMTAIQQTFEAVKEPVQQHYSKPGVYAVQELPVFPDFTLWKWACAQVMFDADPVPQGAEKSSASQALIRGMMDESGEQFVAYFLPTEETLKKRKDDGTNDVSYDPDETYDYKLAREYNWNVKNKASKGYEENYFLVFRDDAVYYNELETRVRLNKRRHKEGVPRVSNSRLLVKHREMNENEDQAQEMRLLQLQHDIEEEDEEEVQALEADQPIADGAPTAEDGADGEDAGKSPPAEDGDTADAEDTSSKDKDASGTAPETDEPPAKKAKRAKSSSSSETSGSEDSD